MPFSTSFLTSLTVTNALLRDLKHFTVTQDFFQSYPQLPDNMPSSKTTFFDLPPEIQLMILGEHFKNVTIKVKYPYVLWREVPYNEMRLQQGLAPLFVSKAFLEVARTALYQSATIYHSQFYLVKDGKESLISWNSTPPEAFRKFKVIEGRRGFAQQFDTACNDDFWPYEDLRQMSIKEYAYHWDDEGLPCEVGFMTCTNDAIEPILQAVKSLQLKCQARSIKLTATFKKFARVRLNHNLSITVRKVAPIAVCDILIVPDYIGNCNYHFRVWKGRSGAGP